jgi:aconitate hydratase
MTNRVDSFKSQKTLNVDGKEYTYFSIKEAQNNGLKNIDKLPKSLKVLTENLLRNEDNFTVKKRRP